MGPERKVRAPAVGSWTVFRGLVWLAVLLAMAGCLEGTPFEELTRPESGESFLVIVEETYSVEGSGEGVIFGDFGPHCTRTQPFQDGDPLVLTHFWHGTKVPPALVVRQFERAQQNATPPVGSISSGPQLYEVDDGARRIALQSPFDSSLILLNLTVSAEGVWVEEEPLQTGSSWNASFSYDVEAGDERYRIEETLTVRSVGLTQVRVEGPPARGCD